MTVQKLNFKKGFTLIELLVVIAVLGMLAVGLIAVIDPADKIKATNDSSAINAITQLGRANDTYAATNNNIYPATATAGAPAGTAANFDEIVSVLFTNGEIKYNLLAEPSTLHTYKYSSLAACINTSPTTAANCTSYVFHTNLISKKYTSTPFFWYANGKGCTQAAAPTVSTATCP